MMQAFLTYVRPTLEYASPIWSPHTLKDITAIESVQRRFTKRLTGLFDLNYHDRLSNLGLETLELRRIKNDLILAYKIIFGLVLTSIKLKINPYNSTRGHQYKLTTPTATCDTTK